MVENDIGGIIMKLSVGFTRFVVRLCYLLLAASVVIVPFVLTMGAFDSPGLATGTAFQPEWITIPFYCVVPAGYAALIAIDIVLGCIKRGDMFTTRIVKALSVLVWSCFYAAVVGVVSFFAIYFTAKYLMVMMLILAAGECFMALICHILKYVFVTAHSIKDENDLTI